MSSDMYREVIIDHYKNPHYKGELDNHTHSHHDKNPLCGDELTIQLIVDENDVIQQAMHNGRGCAISQATADLLVSDIIGRNVEDVKALDKDDLLELLGIELGPVRMKCALLSLQVLKGSLYMGAVGADE